MKAVFMAGILAVSASLVQAEIWVPDPDHTEVRVYWDHSGFSEQSLEFTKVDGTLDFSVEAIPEAQANFSIPVSSLATGVERFNSDLLGATFFDAENYPEISFKSTAFEQVDGQTLKVSGDLTIKDATHPAIFDVTVHRIGEHPVGKFLAEYEGQWIGMTAIATIKRSEWGMGAFVAIGSDELKIVISSEMKAQ